MNTELVDHDFYITSMPGSRAADIYLGCEGGSVFIDFNKSHKGIVSLVRISFDGYGCCRLPADSTPLDSEDSQKFLNMIDSDIEDQLSMSQIISNILKANIESLWTDALEEYKLI